MSELLKRLARLTRAHLADLFAQHWPGRRTETSWYDEAFEEPSTHERASTSSSRTSAGHGLPYSAALAEAYRALDLPFGAPLDQVAKQWKAYLKKCHPDRYAKQPEKQADATRLTQELTHAYDTIKTAWRHYQP
jgi:DnaJ-domain-containing protein 1